MVLAKLKQFTWQNFLNNPVVRWWIVGLFFTGLNLPLSWIFKDLLNFPVWLATLFASEISTLLRFCVIDRWVFGFPSPTWLRLWQYHVAIASSFVIWWSVTNLLVYQFGVHYLLAQILATCCSVGWSMVTNFLWIWRKESDPDPDASAAEAEVEAQSVAIAEPTSRDDR